MLHKLSNCVHPKNHDIYIQDKISHLYLCVYLYGQIRKAYMRGKVCMDNTRAVRKGAWTYEEDKLLKACINKYGEGKWHLVPQRAGLNRCRKSCRLRWLNYLNPNINRESITEDEADMIIRLHNLLGNRWSLIAARLPGRTANDVKNYWHTNLWKKLTLEKEEKKEKEKPNETMKTHEVIKPQPRIFSTHSPWLNKKQNNFVTQPVLASNKDGNVPRDSNASLGTMVSNQIGRDCASASQPCAMLTDNLWNLGEPVGSEKIGSCSSLQEEYFSMEFSTIDYSFWDSNFCDFISL